MGNDKEDRGEPLLKKYHYVPNCPGCEVDRKKRAETGFPFLKIFQIWMLVLVNALPISSLFPFIYFMIRDFGIAEREEDTGYYAGFVGAAFMLGRALTSVFWGVMADRYGRKPVIIISTVTVVIFNTMFGLSVNYWMAIATRFLLGSLNGILGPAKAYSVEVFNEEYQALGMSTVSTALGTGLIIGPTLGGFLAQPAEKFPNLFPPGSLFARFPYFLPCLTISVLAFLVMICAFTLPETLHNHPTDQNSDTNSGEDIETSPCTTSETEAKKTKDSENLSYMSLLTNWPLMSSIIVYCVFSLHEMAYNEIFSLWAVSPRKLGGLSYTTQSVGEVLALSGFSLIFFQMLIYPIVENMFGTVVLCRLTGILTIPLLSLYPCISYLSGTPLFVVLTLASIVKSFLMGTNRTSLFLLQNRVVPQEVRGAANGLSMTLMSLSKAVGPAGGGALLSWAEKRQDSWFLPGTQMVFFILNVVEAIGVLTTFKPFLAV